MYIFVYVSYLCVYIYVYIKYIRGFTSGYFRQVGSTGTLKKILAGFSKAS